MLFTVGQLRETVVVQDTFPQLRDWDRAEGLSDQVLRFPVLPLESGWCSSFAGHNLDKPIMACFSAKW